MALTFKTPGRHGYSVAFSPFYPKRLACASSQHFGIIGCGTVFFLDINNDGIKCVRSFEWNQALFDVTWSEDNENIAVTASGDGAIQVWDMVQDKGPLYNFKEHSQEVYGVHWSQTRNEQLILSASWDKTIKLWDIKHPRSIQSFLGHEGVCYSAVWSPLIPQCFASTSGDQTFRVWDSRKPYMAVIIKAGHDSEILTCDWSKYDRNIILTGAADCSIRGWDLRNTKHYIFQLNGHNYAVRRIKCSPFEGGKLASCSYDFSIRSWNFKKLYSPLETFEHHTEFVYGLDFNLQIPGQVVDCSLDQTIKITQPHSLIPT